MNWLFARGHAADLILLVLAIEVLWLVVKGHVSPARAAAMAAPALCFVLALRAALTGARWEWVALALALAFPAHLADLRLRGWLGSRPR